MNPAASGKPIAAAITGGPRNSNGKLLGRANGEAVIRTAPLSFSSAVTLPHKAMYNNNQYCAHQEHRKRIYYGRI